MFSVWTKKSPSVDEGLDVFSLKREHLVFILRSLDIIKVFVDNSNEDVQENVKSYDLKTDPVNSSNDSFSLNAVMHDAAPILSGSSSKKQHH